MNDKAKAQTSTEYLALVALLCLALALSWDFISGGFQGGVKNLTQSVDISTDDPIKQGSSPHQLPYCDCDDDLNNWACGVEPTTPIPATINCGPRQKYKRKLCTGERCPRAQIEWCEWDKNCCEWLKRDPAGGNGTVHCWNNFCATSSSLPGSKGWGNGRWLKQCGNDPAFHECRGEKICQFACGYDTSNDTMIGTPRAPGSVACPNDDVEPPYDALHWSMAGDGSSKCSVPQNQRWCETYCPAGSAYDSKTNRCEKAVCGDGIVHPTLEVCDPGGDNDLPLAKTNYAGSPRRAGRVQEQACLDNCQTIGYRYHMYQNNNRFRVNPPNHYKYYLVHGGGQSHIYVTCLNGRVIRLHESNPITISTGGFDPHMCERDWYGPYVPTMHCVGDQAVLDSCTNTWGQCGYDNSAEGSPTCRIECNYAPTSKGEPFGTNHSATLGFACEDPPPLNCWAISYPPGHKNTSREPKCSKDVTYGGQKFKGSYEVMDYCEGNCNNDDDRVKWCCRKDSKPDISSGACYAIPQNVPITIPYKPPAFSTCASGYKTWLQYRAFDSQVTYCCKDTITMPSCRAVWKGGKGQPIPRCASDEKQLTGFAGKTHASGQYVRFCCKF